MRKSKRSFLSLLLTLMLVLTMLPTTALAVDAAPVDTAAEESTDLPTADEPASEGTPADEAGEPEETESVDGKKEPSETADVPAGDGENEKDAGEAEDPSETSDVPAEGGEDEGNDESVGPPNEAEDSASVKDEDAENDDGKVFMEAIFFEEEAPGNALGDENDLLTAHLEHLLFNDGIALFGSAARDQLGDEARDFYDKLLPEITKIANGERSDATIKVEYTWTKEELGGTISEDSLNTMIAKYCDGLWNAIWADRPYDCYWMSKTVGPTTGMDEAVFFQPDDPTITVTLSAKIPVAPNYRDELVYYADTTKTAIGKKVTEKVKKIVADNAEKLDHEKLLAYKDAICDLVKYNDDAASTNGTYEGGDPWQLIYVFDDDENTNVVCEGYAKAFQYLCDLTKFDNDIVSYIVTGTMNGGTGAGGHMWNVVKMDDGKNYLVDVTNCDEGSIGAPDKLFLVGVISKSPTQYAFNLGKMITFTYDAKEQGRYTDNDGGYLKLATSNYTYTPPATPSTAKVLTIDDVMLVVKTYDGTTKGTVATIAFKDEDGNTVDLGPSDYTVVATYDNANAGRDKTATVTVTIKNTNLYRLEENTKKVEGSIISPAPATLTVSVSPASQKATKKATVTVVAKNADEKATVQPKAPTLKVDETSLTLNANGTTYTAEYTVPSVAKDTKITFTASLTDSNFTADNAVAVLTVTDKTGVKVDITADPESLTYGDSAAFTATVAKGATDDDELAGEVKVFFDGAEVGKGSNLAGVKVTLNKDKLTAGDHTLKAEFTSGNAFFADGESTTKTITVAPKKLDWDVSGITVAVRQGDEFTMDALKGELAISGALDNDTVKLTVDGLKLSDGFTLDTSTPGKKEVTLVYAEAKIDSPNYALPTKNPVVTATVNAVETLKIPEKEEEKRAVPVDPDVLEEDESLTLELETGISKVPETLSKNKEWDTPAKIVEGLLKRVTELLNNKVDGFVTYDVELMYKKGDSKWAKTTDGKYFPLTVILPYPKGTTRANTFGVAHLKEDGTVETPNVTNVGNGIKFEVTSLSPIEVSWNTPTYSGGGSGGGSSSRDTWESVENAIKKADKGDRIEVRTTENMPWTTMKALYDNGGITLVIKNGKDEIIIPAGKAVNPEAGRIYYPLSYLAELYKGSKIPTGNGGNPETGGVWVVEAPVSVQPTITYPITPEPAPVPEAVEPAPEAPVAETPTATAPTPAVTQPETPAKGAPVGTIVALLALVAAVGAGIWFLWRKRDDDGLYMK